MIDDITLAVDPDAHTYGAWTNLNENQHQRVCANNPAHVETEDHDWQQTGTTPASCIAQATASYECSVCHATKTETGSYGAHQYGEWTEAQPATCSETGHVGYYYCSVCEKYYDAEYNVIDDITLAVDPDAHDFGEWTQTTDPTCLAAGEETRYCSRCDATENRPVEALGHDLEDHEAKEATCLGIGWNAYQTCSRCDYTTYEAIPAKGHTPDDPVKENEVAATCTENGSYDIVVYCAVCGEEISRVPNTIPAGHTAGEPVKENETDPTCTVPGSYDAVVYCTACGNEISRDAVEIPALGHDWSEWQIVTAPTTSAPGTARRICFRCSEIETQEIPSLDAPKNRKVQFVVSGSMHYVVHYDEYDYEIRSKTTPAIMWYEERPLTFSVATHSEWGEDGVIVSLNGVELQPNYDGTYTIPAGTDYAKINCYPKATASSSGSESGSGNAVCAYCGEVHPNSLWGRLMAIFHAIFLFFKNLFKK